MDQPGEGEDAVGRILEKWANDLWIKRRLELSQVLEALERLQGLDPSSNKDVAGHWLQFVQFLDAHCSGLHFSHDKQWSELMNLMQISKKLNHRSVKFRDIIKNKRLVEANHLAIRRLNKWAQLLQTIESSLGQLEATLNNDCVLLVPPDSPQQQLVELEASKRFLEERCCALLHTLQLELHVSGRDDVPASCGPQLEQSRARCDKLGQLIGNLLDFLSHSLQLYEQLSQLDPLINAQATACGEATTKGSELETTLGTCKQFFNQVLEYRRDLTSALMDLASSSSSSRNGGHKHHKSRVLQLKKLTSPVDNDLVKRELLKVAMEEALGKLEQCRGQLDAVMHNLRLEFGRFYFLSDLELLTMIALDAKLVQPEARHRHLLGKLFNNSLQGFVLDASGQQQVVGVQGSYEEVILFPVQQVGSVPLRKSLNLYSLEIVRILNDTLRRLRKSLQYLLGRSLASSDPEDIDWTLPVQLMNLAEQVRFCRRVEAALGLSNSSLEQVVDHYETRFRRLSGLRPEEIESPVESSSSATNNRRLAKFKHSAAVSMTVHFLSSLASLGRAEGGSRDWRWLRQVRYYVDAESPETSVEVRIADTSFEYKFDYLAPQTNDTSQGPESGGFKRLINTQVTGRCLLAASQSIGNFRLGSSPYGPAGSGKTETIKALGLALGCQVIVHNCDESNDGQSLDRLVWGLAHTGLWGCFDEFNRLSASALSSISASLELVQASIRESRRMVELPDGRMMPVDEATAFFVTMNPAGAGYRGRRRLPANLRQLFLPIAMTRLQVAAIASESLLALGAELGNANHLLSSQEADKLAARLASLMEELASLPSSPTQAQTTTTCVWDLRLVMATLRRLKHLAQSTTGSGATSLSSLLVQSIAGEVRPRLANGALSSFNALLARHFSLTSSSDIEAAAASADESLRQELRKASLKLLPEAEVNLTSLAEQRALDLKQLLDSRAGVILLGPAGCGKSTTWRLLHAASGDYSIQWLPVNPRACPREALFGRLDEATNKWSDGLVTARVRQALEMLREPGRDLSQVWLVLDGPIEPDWVETFNSVLDDNQVLTLGSGERLSFNPSPNKCLKLLVESDSLEFASPATISRLGLVLHEPIDQQVSREHSCLTISSDQLDEQVAEARDLILKTSPPLVVIIQDPFRSQRKSQEFMARLLGAKCSVVEYNCSPLSTCVELLALVTDTQPDWFVIKNLHLIQVEDQWHVKSFLELLRFMVVYGGFYDQQQQLMFRKLKARFVVTLDSLDHIDPRCLTGAQIVRIEHELAESNFIRAEVSDAGQYLEENYSSDQPMAVISLSSSNSGTDRRRSIARHFNQQEHKILLTFSNTKQASRSLGELEELLLGSKSNHFKVDSSSSSSSSGGKVVIFILSDLECKLLPENLKRKLFHHLNKLKRIQGRAKFVYLAQALEDPKNLNEATFWHSLGPVVVCLNDLNQNLPIDTREYLKNLIDRAELKDPVDSQWMLEKVTKFIQSDPIQASIMPKGQRLIESYVTTASQLIRTSRLELEGQRRRLDDGLGRLEEFEAQVMEIKSRCQVEEEELNGRKQEISKLMLSIDGALKGSIGQRDKLQLLKQQQMGKQLEIDQQSEQVNRELSEVSLQVESSKAEVAQHLKPEALNEIKALRSPPTTIKDILDVLFTLLRIEDCSWPSMRSHLTKYSLREELTNYDFQRNLDEALLDKARRQMDAKRDSFSVQQAARASKAIVPVLAWIKAAIEYGQVLIRLRPLSERMRQLQLEASELSSEAQRLEGELVEVDERISGDTGRLDRLKLDYEESLGVATSVRKQLERAQLARHNVEGQICRWRERLAYLRRLLKMGQGELMGLCATTAAATVFYDFHDNHLLEEWLELFQVGVSSRAEFVAKALDLLASSAMADSEIVFKPEEANKMLQLLCMRLSLELASVAPLLVDLAGAQHELGRDELEQYLAHRSLLCQQRSSVALIKCHQLHDWRQSIELSLRLGKLVLVELDDDQDNSSLDLDIMDYVNSVKCRGSMDTGGGGGAGKEISSRLPLVLVGKLDKHSVIGNLVRPVRLLTGKSSREEVQASVMTYLLELGEPELSRATRKLEFELQTKRQECKQRELRLLERLATITIAKVTNSRPLSIEEDLVRILGEFRQLSESLELDSRLLESKRAELEACRRRYEVYASEAATFYLDHLSNLGQQSKFCHLPLETYLKLLVIDNPPEVKPPLPVVSLNYDRVLRQARRPMSPRLRQQFESRLQQTGRPEDLQPRANDRESLRGSLMEVLHEMATGTGEQSAEGPRLMVVLHEPTRSSPQLEVDELFRQLPDNLPHCSYSKFYATSDSFERLQATLKGLAADPASDKQRESRSQQATRSDTLRCLCIANAHLAAKWLNLHLTQTLDTLDRSSGGGGKGTKFLIILIGESCSEQVDSEQLGSSLLERAQVKCWHDDSMLEFTHRLGLLSRSMCCHQEFARSLAGEKGKASQQLMELLEHSVLLHVVCQEGAGELNLWRRNYSFDHDQLYLALKTLVRLVHNKEQRQVDNIERLRQVYCHYLTDFVYGARMETLEDELTLERLIQRFVGARESGCQQLDRAHRLEAHLRANKMGQYERELKDLVVGGRN